MPIVACQIGPTNCVITESVFNTIAPQAVPPFSYAGFCKAVSDWNMRNPNNLIESAGFKRMQGVTIMISVAAPNCVHRVLNGPKLLHCWSLCELTAMASKYKKSMQYVIRQFVVQGDS